MAVTIDSFIQPFAWIAGSDWPEGDEDGLFRIAEHWHQSGRTLSGLHEDLSFVGSNIAESIEGNGADQLSTLINALTKDGGDKSLLLLIKELERLGDAAQNAGTEMEFTKIVTVINLTILAVQVAIALAEAAPSFGASTAQIPVWEAITQGIIRQAASKALIEIGKKAAVAAVKSAVMSLVVQGSVQGAQVLRGTRKTMDGSQLLGNAANAGVAGFAGGMIGGVTKGLAGDAANKLLPTPKTLIGVAGREAAIGAITKPVSGALTNTVLGKPISLSDMTRSSLTGAVSGGMAPYQRATADAGMNEQIDSLGRHTHERVNVNTTTANAEQSLANHNNSLNGSSDLHDKISEVKEARATAAPTSPYLDEAGSLMKASPRSRLHLDEVTDPTETELDFSNTLKLP